MPGANFGSSSKAVGRRFNLSDLLIIVAATALGLAPMRLARWGAEYGTGRGWRMPYSSPLRRIELHAAAPLFACALCVAVLSLRQPRPSLRRLVRRPGFVASVLASAGAVPSLISFAEEFATVPATMRGDEYRLEVGNMYLNSTTHFMSLAALMITGAWLVIAISWSWRPGRNWIDRVGCLAGLAPILLFWGTYLFIISNLISTAFYVLLR